MTSFILSHKRQIMAVFISVALSVLFVSIAAFGATYVDTDSVGIATSAPGGALGVKGVAIVDGFVSANYFTSTSTNSSWIFGNLGLGTTTPGAFLGVKGAVLVDGFLLADYFTATSSGSETISSPGMISTAVRIVCLNMFLSH